MSTAVEVFLQGIACYPTNLYTYYSRDLSEYYGYLPELSTFLLDLFSPAECVEYMDASDRPRPLVIRANTLKTTRKDLMEALTKRGANVEVVDWSKVAIKVTESSVPIGATPEYLGGHYMLQSAASMNPVLALAPQPNERVLDMSGNARPQPYHSSIDLIPPLVMS